MVLANNTILRLLHARNIDARMISLSARVCRSVHIRWEDQSFLCNAPSTSQRTCPWLQFLNKIVAVLEQERRMQAPRELRALGVVSSGREREREREHRLNFSLLETASVIAAVWNFPAITLVKKVARKKSSVSRILRKYCTECPHKSALRAPFKLMKSARYNYKPRHTARPCHADSSVTKNLLC